MVFARQGAEWLALVDHVALEAEERDRQKAAPKMSEATLKARSRKHSLLLFLAEREAPPENQTLREALRPGAILSALRRFSSRFLL